MVPVSCVCSSYTLYGPYGSAPRPSSGSPAPNHTPAEESNLELSANTAPSVYPSRELVRFVFRRDAVSSLPLSSVTMTCLSVTFPSLSSASIMKGMPAMGSPSTSSLRSVRSPRTTCSLRTSSSAVRSAVSPSSLMEKVTDHSPLRKYPSDGFVSLAVYVP